MTNTPWADYIGKFLRHHKTGCTVEIIDFMPLSDTFTAHNKTTSELEYISLQSVYSGNWEVLSAMPPRSKCECGTSIVMGKEDEPKYHSYYCPIAKEIK